MREGVAARLGKLALIAHEAELFLGTWLQRRNHDTAPGLPGDPKFLGAAAADND